MMKNYKRSLSESKGFTLIELLVVIAIIGILASIILASLSSARSKGGDAAVKSDLHNLQSQAELDNNNNCYAFPASIGCTAALPAVQAAGACPAAVTSNNTIFQDPQVIALIAGATASGSSGGGTSLSACSEPVGGAAWAVAVVLSSDKALAWCVDSTGVSKQEGTAGGTSLAQAGVTAFTTAAGKCL